jgi:hypothetical protein
VADKCAADGNFVEDRGAEVVGAARVLAFVEHDLPTQDGAGQRLNARVVV